MAIRRALLTTPTDYQIIDDTKAGYEGLEINSLIYYNAETDPVSLEEQPGSIVGSKKWYPATRPTADKFVEGIRGKALKHEKARYYTFVGYHFPASTKYQISLFFKPTAADIAATFAIIATNRGLGFSPDRGFHIALNTGVLDLRIYGTDGTSLLTGTSGASNGYPKFTFIADQWYHVAMMYDGANNTVEVLINGQTQIYVAVVPKFTVAFERGFTIGDMPTSSTTISTNAFSGVIDEVFYLYGDNSLTRDQFLTYYDVLINRRLLDDRTEAGSLQLPRLMDGTYRAGSIYSWESDVLDIGDPIDYYGRLHMNAVINPDDHNITLYTRTSDDGVNFDPYRVVGSDGSLLSSNKSFYQIKAELVTSVNDSTPVLRELELLEYERPIVYTLFADPLKVYKDLDTGLEPMGILNKAYDIWIEEEVKSKEILTFNLPMNDPKRTELGKEAVEYLLELGNRRFILKENNDVKDSGGKKKSGFKAEAKWYELNDNKHPDYELIDGTVGEHVTKALGECLPATTWKLVGDVSGETKRRTIRGTWISVLALLRDIESTFGVELQFNTLTDEIIITSQIGTVKDIRFYYSKNLREIERTIDTYGIITRLYPYGAGTLDIKTVHPQGLDYVENLTWVNKLALRNKIRPDVWKDERYTIPQDLYEDSQLILEEMARPNISYKMGVIDLSSRSGHEPETIGLGDTVSIIDDDLLDGELPSRIMRRKFNVREPQKTEVELDQPRKELADAQQRAFDDNVITLTESDPISAGDIQEMTVFNHLLNSRADSGLLEWVNVGNSGITASSEGGFSGENSFKLVAGYGEFKNIQQEIHNVAHRSTYTISAMVYKEGNITAGANGFVGIRVRVKYKPDAQGISKEEIKLLKLPDVTNMTYEEV